MKVVNNMKELFQNTEINNDIISKNSEIIYKNLKKFTIRPNYFLNPFFTWYILTNWSLPQPVSQKKKKIYFFLWLWFPTNKHQIKKQITN